MTTPAPKAEDPIEIGPGPTVIVASILRIGVVPDPGLPGMMIPPPMYPTRRVDGSMPASARSSLTYEDIVYFSVSLDWPYTGNLQIGIHRGNVIRFLVGGKLKMTIEPGDPDDTFEPPPVRAFAPNMSPAFGQSVTPPSPQQTPNSDAPPIDNTSTGPQPATPAQVAASPNPQVAS